MIGDLVDFISGLAQVPVVIGPLGIRDKVGLVLLGGQFSDRQLDGGKIRFLPFQILVKDRDQSVAVSLCESLVQGLDGLTGLVLGGQRLIVLECTTTTNFVDKDSEENYLYTALFKAEFGG